RSNRGKNGKDEWRSGSEPPSPTNEPPPSPRIKHHQRTCQELGLEITNEQNNALKVKKQILLSSLCSGSGWSEADNIHRLGPNRYNVFENLHKSPVTSPRAEEEGKNILSDILQNVNSDEMIRSGNLIQGNSIENVSNYRKNPEHNISPKHKPKTDKTSETMSKRISQPTDSNAVYPENKHCPKSNLDSSDHASSKLESKEQITIKKSEEVDNELKLVTKLEEVWISTDNSRPNDIHFIQKSEEVLKNNSIKQDNTSSEEIMQDVEDIELMELDVFDMVPEFLEISVPHTPISITTAVELKKVVLGSASDIFSPQWLTQGFVFSTNHKLRYGFVQKKGGSCGILATVQAFVLKNLLFEQNACNCSEPLRPTRLEVSSALVRAFGDMLWRAGLEESAILALSSDVNHLMCSSKYIPDGITEKLNLTSFNSREDLETGIKNNLDQFTNATGSGCLLILFSAVLSRGLHRVKNDMDECSPLIGSNGQCTLELVNLLLTGYAVSNVFDNNLQVDSCWLRGVNTRADIGFLSLFEHYNSCQVGSYLKTPRYPIWVICSENHFSVLFSCRRELVSDWRAEKRFNLYYYDGLARQDDEIKLTV
ncbi:hypothetical protein L9F63_004341, partial [Diploptera punctata]